MEDVIHDDDRTVEDVIHDDERTVEDVIRDGRNGILTVVVRGSPLWNKLKRGYVPMTRCVGDAESIPMMEEMCRRNPGGG